MDLKALPKVELHCHLDGMLGPAMAQDIYSVDPTFPIGPDKFQRVGSITDSRSFFKWLDVIDPIEGELDHFYPILGRYIQQLKAQNVRYSEVMIASGEVPRDEVEAVEKLGAFRQWVNQQEAGEIQVEFLVVFARLRPPEDVAELAQTILALYKAGLIVGAALAGPERGHPIKPHQKSLAKLREAGLGIEIHAGEWAGPESVWDALEYGRPDRIGHGISVFRDPELLDAIRARRIHIEMCPTSNLITGSVARIEEHPLARAKELDLSFSINTDDPGPFGCSLTSEYELVSRVFGFQESDFQKVYDNSLGARFQPELRVGHETGHE